MLCQRRRARGDAGVRRLYRRPEHPRCGVREDLPARRASWRMCSATTGSTPSPRRAAADCSESPRPVIPGCCTKCGEHGIPHISERFRVRRPPGERAGMTPASGRWRDIFDPDAYAAFACTCRRTRPADPASRSVAGLASGAATSATSVLSIGAKAVLRRQHAMVGLDRDLRQDAQPQAGGDRGLDAGEARTGVGHVPGAAGALDARGSRGAIQAAGGKGDQRHRVALGIERMVLAGDPVHPLRPHRDRRPSRRPRA